MDYDGIKNALCDERLALIQQTSDYPQIEARDGALFGIGEIRNTTTPDALADLLTESRRAMVDAFAQQDEKYHYWRSRESEIEWAANVISAALYGAGLPIITPPTTMGLLKAVDLMNVGVSDD